MAALRVGLSYEIETQEREYNGRTFSKITKGTLLAGWVPKERPGEPAMSDVNHTQEPGAGRAPHPAQPGEPEFVARVLSAMLARGGVRTETDLFDAARTLRRLYQVTFR